MEYVKEDVDRGKIVRKIISILILIIVFVIVIIIGFQSFDYFFRDSISFNENIESVLISEDGNFIQINLIKDSNLSDILKIDFIFKDKNNSEFFYSTTNISNTPFYEIALAEVINLSSFSDVERVEVILNSRDSFVEGFDENNSKIINSGEGGSGGGGGGRSNGGSGSGGGGGGGGGGGDGCIPQTCLELGRTCGIIDNGCGNNINCGSCPSGKSCNANGQCVSSYTPKTCPQLLLNPDDVIITLGPENISQIQDIVRAAEPYTTILLEDGIYPVRELVFRNPFVTLRSKSGNRDSVILDGRYITGEIIAIYASNITIADLTIKRAYYHLIHIKSGGHYAMLYNLRIVDGREQQIKINPDTPTSDYHDFGTLACSLIEITDTGRKYIDEHLTSGWTQCYTGGLDAHKTQGWVVRDNVFKGIYCLNGLAEHAVHIWKSSRDWIVERNVFINNSIAIGFGMDGYGGFRDYPDNPLNGTEINEEEVEFFGGIIRNNFIYADIEKYDSGISLWQSWNTTVIHNTIYSEKGIWDAAIDTRFEHTDALIKNNLYYPTMREREGAHPTKIGNVLASPEMFRNIYSGDMHLLDSAKSVIDKGERDNMILDDIDGEARDSLPDVGADELK